MILSKFKHSLYWTVIKLSRSNYFFRNLIDYLALYFYKIARYGKSFKLSGKKYRYFYHIYNRTVAGERIVEIPIAFELLRRYEPEGVLEIGNVLSHYFPAKHDIVDKYEKGEGVTNQDVADFKLKKKYKLIISVSTMEHVGFNYGEKKDSKKFLKAFKNLKKHLKENGKVLVTLPLFFNPEIDKLIKRKRMPFTKEYFLQRYSFWNEWREVDYEKAISGAVYEGYFANSNVIYIGVYEN